VVPRSGSVREANACTLVRLAPLAISASILKGTRRDSIGVFVRLGAAIASYPPPRATLVTAIARAGAVNVMTSIVDVTAICRSGAMKTTSGGVMRGDPGPPQ
jgi:hypothetical protein